MKKLLRKSLLMLLAITTILSSSVTSFASEKKVNAEMQELFAASDSFVSVTMTEDDDNDNKTHCECYKTKWAIDPYFDAKLYYSIYNPYDKEKIYYGWYNFFPSIMTDEEEKALDAKRVRVTSSSKDLIAEGGECVGRINFYWKDKSCTSKVTVDFKCHFGKIHHCETTIKIVKRENPFKSLKLNNKEQASLFNKVNQNATSVKMNKKTLSIETKPTWFIYKIEVFKRGKCKTYNYKKQTSVKLKNFTFSKGDYMKLYCKQTTTNITQVFYLGQIK